MLDFAARHTCDSPEWYTPSPIVEAAREVMGEIELDPASHEEANRTVKAHRFFTAQDDGLKWSWLAKTVFLNPPGGKDAGGKPLVPQFWRHLINQWLQNHFQSAIWIGYSLEQLQTLQRVGSMNPMQFPICITSTRIAFVENEAKKIAHRAKVLAEGEAPGATLAKRLKAKMVRADQELPDSPSHSNYITYLGQDPKRFEAVFKQLGQVRI